MDAVAPFARHPVLYVAALAGAAMFGAFALGRTLREETAGSRVRDLGLTALAAAEVGGTMAMRPKIQEEQALLGEVDRAEIIVAA